MDFVFPKTLSPGSHLHPCNCVSPSMVEVIRKLSGGYDSHLVGEK